MVQSMEREAERPDAEHMNILRWEDDGGQGIECVHSADHSTPEVAVDNNQPMTLKAKAELERLQRH